MFVMILSLIFTAFEPVHPACSLVADRLAALPDAPQRLLLCSSVANAAHQRGSDVPMMIELAWAESGFTDVVHPSSGCAGVLQAHPRWTCPEGRLEGCDTVEAGLDAWDYWLTRKKDPEVALCHYNSGNVCHPRSLKWARVVRSRAEKLRQRLVGEM